MSTQEHCACTEVDDLLTTAEVAARLALAVGTLQNWRSAGVDGPPYVRIRGRVRYRASDLSDWIERLPAEV